MKRIKLETKHYQWGLTAFLVVVCCVLAFFAIYRFDVIHTFFSFINRILAPFVYGFVMAYLVCPIYNFTVQRSYAGLSGGRLQIKQDLVIAKLIGTIVSIIVYLVVIIGITLMIAPGLFNSILSIVDSLPTSTTEVTNWINKYLSKLPIDESTLQNMIDNSLDNLIKFLTDTVIPHSQTLAMSLSHGVLGAVGFLKNFLIGMIISVYFLNGKDTFLAQIKKMILAVFKDNTADRIFDVAKFTNKTFGGFISGKIIDSIIIGMICFLVMSIFSWEYALLISCIIGLTNIIPFFGPFIGAIPSAMLLLLENPIHALYFLIFITILQQFDGNILGPKIIGDSTGLDSFWVLFAVLVGGGIFGFVGMVIGIPIFAVIYYYLCKYFNNRLEVKGYSTDLSDYRIDPYRIKPETLKRKFSKRMNRFKKNKDDENADDRVE